MRVGVFLCQCAGNISGVIDLNSLRAKAESFDDVGHVSIDSVLCSEAGLGSIGRAIRSLKLDRIVVVGCSPHLHEDVFRDALSRSGLNPFLLECVNIREQCSFVHKNKRVATEKAVDLMLGGLFRARELQPLTPSKKRVCKHALVIGGGIAGITCSLEIADSGYPVTLVERKPSIGGHMAQLTKAFPAMDCVPCILSPIINDVAKHPNIDVLEMSEVGKVSGGVGDFSVEVIKRPRGVDASLCVRCGRCSEICPIIVPNEFDEGLYNRKAIYLPFAEAYPSAYALDFENCDRCGRCVAVCPTSAIALNSIEDRMRIRVGAIVVSSGFDLLDLSAFEEVGFKHPNVITALQMERMIGNELTEGRVLRRGDGKRVKRIAYLLCTGSRDVRRGVSYCSRVCCPYAIKQAILLKKTLPYTDIWVYFTDMRMSGRGFEELWNEARDLGVVFVRGKPGEIVLERGGELRIIAEDRDSGVLIRNRVDLIVSTPPMIPAKGAEELAEKLKIPLREDRFIAEKHQKVNPLMSCRAGIFAAGAALGPKDIRDSVADAKAAAADAINLFKDDEILLETVRPTVDVRKCVGCGECVAVCPQKALTLENGKAAIDYLSCSGCGSCVAVCESLALDMAHYTRKQIEQQIKGTLSSDRERIQVIGFFGDAVAYRTADALGAARLAYPEALRIIRVPSTALVSSRAILLALALGADAVALCEGEGSSEAEATRKNMEEAHRILADLEVEDTRVMFEPTSLPAFRELNMFITAHVSKITSLGKIPCEVREKIAAASFR